MKGKLLSPTYLGGVEYREKHRNVNHEFNSNNDYYNFIANQNNKSLPNKRFADLVGTNNSSGIYSNYCNGLNHDLTQTQKSINNTNTIEYPRQTPINKVFGSIFLNDYYGNKGGDDSEYYSKKKIQLMKDYSEMVNKQDECEFKKDQLQKRSIEQGNNVKRLKDIERSISPPKNNFYEYNKRYEMKTVFDDKKILYNKANYGNYYPSNINKLNIVNNY
jgi:hypothetical protein